MSALPVHGVDISHHQNGRLNMPAAKAAGVRWLYHKATEGQTYKDPNYAKRRAEAAKAGLPFGAYHFARPSATKGDATAEAKFFISIAKPAPGDLKPCLDIEVTDGLSMTKIKAWVAEFVAYVKKATGVMPVVYTQSSWNLGTATDGCIVWRARYNNDNRPPVLPYDIHQFSNGVYGSPNKIVGFGNVDLNTMRKGLTLKQLQIPVKKPAAPKKKTMKLRFAHLSMQFSDTPREMEKDVDTLFKRGYDVITGTEAGHGSGKLVDLILAGATKYGYKVSKPGRYDTWVAVKKTLVHSEWQTGSEFALWRSSRTEPTPKGRWGDKGVVWASWNMGPTFGEFAVGSVHYLTNGGAGDWKVPSDKVYAKVIGEWAAEQGSNVSVFIGGDFNKLDRTNDVFYGQPLTTCWDDLKKWPNTGHGNIDAIARYDKNARVKCVDARVLDDSGLFLNTDHFLVEAEYQITAA